MIDRTILLIDRLSEYHEREHVRRYARRNRLRRLDGLLEQFEELNLRDVEEAPRSLAHRVYGLAYEDYHPLLCQPLGAISIAQWMETLFDLQDPLLFYSEDIEEATPPD